MINLQWVKHGAGNHKLFSASSDLNDGAGHDLITAYSVQQPDGTWSVMVINKDQSNPHTVRLVFEDGSGTTKTFTGTVQLVTFGSEQYVWRSAGADSHPDPNNPPVSKTVSGDPITLPKASLNIVRGRVEPVSK